MPKHKDITGQRFGSLVVLQRAENDAQQNAQWLCRCDCGQEKVIRGGALRQGHTRSCGCLHDKKASERMTAMRTKHGHSGSLLYKVRTSMIARCYKPQTKGYHRYGGRGITVCDEWLHSFDAFYDWAMQNGYKQGLQIDRIDNDGNYCPENCRFVSSFDNCQNTSVCIPVKITNLESSEVVCVKTMSEASRQTGVSIRTIARMLKGIRATESRFAFEILPEI